MQPKLRDRRLYWRGNVIWCRVLGPAGTKVRRATGCTDEAAAVARANEYERTAADPRYATAAATSLSGAIGSLLDDMRRRKRAAATLKKAGQKLGHFVRIWGGDLPMLRVNARLVLEYIDKRQRETASDHTIYMELGHLRMVLKIAIHLGTFVGKVEEVLPPYFGSGHKPRERWATGDELRALLAALAPHRAAHVLYIVATGARLGESFRARRRDTDRVRGVVHLHGTKTEASDGDVPITRISAPLLEQALADAPGKDGLFRPWGKIHRDLEAACVRAGIAKLGPNDLRRTFGKWHRLAGVDVSTISKMLRHTTDKLAQTTYAKVTGEEVGALVAHQLRDVPVLYRATAETSTKGDQMHNEQAEKQAPPGELESPANALGKRRQNARSAGNKKAWERRRALSTVPELCAGEGEKTPAKQTVAAAIDAYLASEYAAGGAS